MRFLELGRFTKKEAVLGIVTIVSPYVAFRAARSIESILEEHRKLETVNQKDLPDNVNSGDSEVIYSALESYNH